MYLLMRLRQWYVAAFLVALLALVGCSGEQTLPHIARTGETIVVALDGTLDIGAHDVIRSEDLAATIMTAVGTEVAVRVRDVLRVYPDHTSVYMHHENQLGINSPSYHEGLWLAVVDLVDPTSGEAPALVANDESYIATMSFSHASYTLADFSIEILPGSGSTNPFDSQELASTGLNQYVPSMLGLFSPQPHIVVRPSSVSVAAYYAPTTGAADPADLVAGMSLTVQYDPSRFSTASPAVKPINHNSNVQLLHSHRQISATLAEFNVVMTCPGGFVDGILGNVSGNEEKAHIGELAFAIVWPEQITPASWGTENSDITDANFLEAFTVLGAEFVKQSGLTVAELQHEIIKPR